MPRRSACGHNPSRQLPKSAAAARIAAADINGLPDAPDCPLHSRAPPAGGGTEGAAGVSQLSGLSCTEACAKACAGTAPAKAAAISGIAARRKNGAGIPTSAISNVRCLDGGLVSIARGSIAGCRAVVARGGTCYITKYTAPVRFSRPATVVPVFAFARRQARSRSLNEAKRSTIVPAFRRDLHSNRTC